jgi:hypothetical protein
VLKKIGANSYRFSISWPRVIPGGGREDPVNEAGLQFYDDLIDELLAAGIQPFVVGHVSCSKLMIDALSVCSAMWFTSTSSWTAGIFRWPFKRNTTDGFPERLSKITSDTPSFALTAMGIASSIG